MTLRLSLNEIIRSLTELFMLSSQMEPLEEKNNVFEKGFVLI